VLITKEFARDLIQQTGAVLDDPSAMSKCSHSHFGMHEQHRSEPLRAPFWHLSVLHRLPPPHRCKGLASHHVQLLCRSLGAVNPLPRGRGFVRQVPCAAHIGFRLAVGFVAMRLLLSIFEPEPPSPLPEPESSSVSSESPSLLSAHLRLLFASASFAASWLGA
jgi:hypothetical protein